MTLPSFNSRLEAIRLLVQAIRGDDAATVARIIELLEGQAPYLQEILGEVSDLTEFFPEVMIYEVGEGAELVQVNRLERIQTALEDLVAAGPGGGGDMSELLLVAQSIDTRLNNMFDFLQTNFDGLVAYLADPVSGEGAGALLAQLVTAQQQTNTLLQQLVDCLCDGTGGPPAFPAGECELYPDRYGAVAPRNVLGTPPANAATYIFTLDVTNPSTNVGYLQDSVFDFTWITVNSTDDQQGCIAFNLPEEYQTGVTWQLWRQATTLGDPPVYNAAAGQTINLGATPQQGSVLFTFLGREPDLDDKRHYYALQCTTAQGTPLLAGIPGVWISFGAFG